MLVIDIKKFGGADKFLQMMGYYSDPLVENTIKMVANQHDSRVLKLQSRTNLDYENLKYFFKPSWSCSEKKQIQMAHLDSTLIEDTLVDDHKVSVHKRQVYETLMAQKCKISNRFIVVSSILI